MLLDSLELQMMLWPITMATDFLPMTGIMMHLLLIVQSITLEDGGK
jgi:hypothetical protein